MRSKLHRRIVSLLALVVFSTTGAADAYGLHSCPHHDALPETPHQQHAHRADAQAATVTSHGQHSHDSADAPASPAEHDGHGPCTCVGECSSNPPAAPLEAAPVTVVASLATRHVVVPAQVQPHACTTPYLLPWPNAPPVSASR
ncbi:MAG TPA: hypothetical protein VFU06_08420 [Longimicrobiales bacterium]|nr:hypothetical protein [Longimicrobiales bacterium]